MSRVLTGGPAFPGNHTYIDGMPSNYEGMDLRDWFAGHALSGVIVQCAADHDTNRYAGGPATYFAMKAYELADAMLAQKAKATLANQQADRDEYDDNPF
jgi:hypothetical protein